MRDVRLRYFQSMEALVIRGHFYNNATLNAARNAGWRLRWVDPVLRKQIEVTQFEDAIINIWAMEEYIEVVYVHTDVAFVASLEGSFFPSSEKPTGCKVWAVKDMSSRSFVENFDTGVIAIRPDRDEFAALTTKLKDETNEPFSLNLFLNKVYNKQNGAWCELERQKNANMATFSQNRSLWDATRHIQLIHYTQSKPWQCEDLYKPLCSIWNEEEGSNVYPVTIVTAFYPGPSKHGISEYIGWGRTFLQQPIPIVIFTDNRHSIVGLADRNPNMTCVEELTMDEFSVSRAIFNWTQQLNMDPERSIHSPRLFKLWLEKTWFVMRAIRLNPFHSAYYVWVDFGCFRSRAWLSGSWTALSERFPSRDRILLLNFPEHHPTKKVAGGVIGGSVQAWRRWTPLFDHVLVSHANANFFIGDDQVAMSIMAAQHPDVVCRVTPANNGDDPFWYSLYYLAGRVDPQLECNQIHPMLATTM
jgi:hypothetical protein